MNKIWDDLSDYFSNDRRDYYANSVESKKIHEAETQLSVNFSIQYQKFLSLYGGAMISGDVLYGLEKQDDMDDQIWRPFKTRGKL